ncbi:MAG: CPBP family intramembrane metalloprotease [Deltaproteobacteria bacterium]|nr:CPBP family intramembrane metalloprotease [Deltaproteobacteria bacterium]
MADTANNPRNLLTSLILVFPLFIVYQVGVLFTLPILNGADFVTTLLFATLGLTLKGYLVFLASVVLGFVLALALLKRTQQFNGKVFLPVVLESAVYALTMGSVIVLLMTKVLGISPTLAVGLPEQGFLTRLVMSLGAGVYEESVFRLGLLSGSIAVFDRALRMNRWAAVVGGFALSSVVFSLAHYLPPMGDPFGFGSFTFRVLAGVVFGALYKLRGFAVAVYTHAFYDVFVLVVH